MFDDANDEFDDDSGAGGSCDGGGDDGVEAQVQRRLAAAMRSGASPEEVCGDAPDLLPLVRQRWDEVRRLSAELDVLFPSTSGHSPAVRAAHRWSDLPTIPGYAVLGMLGRGGMGVVYRARHERLDRPVALKMLLAGPHASRAELAMFTREARAVAALRHPNVVQVYDVGEADGRPYFTMELVEGGSLAERLGGAPLPAAAAAAAAAALADAVAAAHRAGIVHRDLKPSNVLLGPDGTPKVSDFGLARRVEADDGISLAGGRIGTPSYMAPEQAAGRPVTPLVDVYSLGAILYETLTGRPPFRGESPAETERQVLTQDPVPPCRLNPRATRDLQTICLKCLEKDPRRRYASADALADDLRRYQRGEPITARPTGLMERAVKWVRRHPTGTAALASGTVAAMLILGGSLWLMSQRAAVDRAVAQDLREAKGLLRQSSWTAADAALDRAAVRLGNGGSAALRDGLARGRADAALAAQLERVHLEASVSNNGALNLPAADAGYVAAFGDAGLGVPTDAPGAVAAAVRASDVRGAAVDALDVWACCVGPERRRWLCDVALLADPDPTGWRDRVRRAARSVPWGPLYGDGEPARAEPPGLTALAADPRATGAQPVSLLITLGCLLKSDSTDFLTRVQRAHPGEFWANLAMAGRLSVPGRSAEALRYYQAALALRPGAALVYNNMGYVLHEADQPEEALACYRQAAALDPSSLRFQGSVATTMLWCRPPAEALAELQRVIALGGPDVPLLECRLGDCHALLHHHDEAIAAFGRAIALDPTQVWAWSRLRVELVRARRDAEVPALWVAGTAATPDRYDAWHGYAPYCLYARDEPGYRRVRQELMSHFGSTADAEVAGCVGYACLLLPPDSRADLNRVRALVDRAVAADQHRPENARSGAVVFAQGLAEYRAGHDHAAIDALVTLSGRLQPSAQLVTALAEWRLGRTAAARSDLATVIGVVGWQPDHADVVEAWVCHVLRREAEAIITPAK